MTAFSEEFVIGSLPLADAGQPLSPIDVKLKTEGIRSVLMKIVDRAPWQKYTRLATAVSGTPTGLECILGIEPAPQAYLETRGASGENKRIAEAIIREKRMWVDALDQNQSCLIGLKVARAALASAAFRPGVATSEFDPTERKLLDSLADLLNYVSSPAARLETRPWQLDIPGFDGYEWVKDLQIVGQPSRRTYGVSVLLLQPVPAKADGIRAVQIHYLDLNAQMQEQLDAAARTRSKIWLTGFLGVRGVPKAPAVFQPTELGSGSLTESAQQHSPGPSDTDPFPRSSYARLEPASAELAGQSTYSLGYSSHREGRFEEATQLFGEAAARGDERAWTMLGSMAHSGHGREVDYALAHDCFEKAAAKGFAPAIRALGNMALHGHGQQADPVEAIRMFALAEVRGEPRAAATLAMMHMFGQGVPRDPVTARRYAENAAEAGDALGKAVLGSMMCQGIAGAADPAHGFALITEAAPDNPWAKYQLGVCFERGLGTSVDLDRAAAAYWDAVNGGISAAKKRLDQLLGVSGQ